MSRSEFRSRMVRPAPKLERAVLALDPMTAALAKSVGFDSIYLGGGAFGYRLGVSEALLTQSEVTEATRAICERVDINVVVDGTAGWGDPLHVARTIRMVEQAGAAAIEIEDQLAPKRAHHQKGIEHMVPKQDMVDKIKFAVDARSDPNFVIIARCNAIRHDGIEDALDRAEAYAEAGADLLMFGIRTEDEFQTVSKGTKLPLATLGWGGDGRSNEEWRKGGFALACDAASLTLVIMRDLKRMYENLHAGEGLGVEREDRTALITAANTLIGMDRMYEIEAQTTERALYTK